MKALSIVAVVFAGVSFIIPWYSIYLTIIVGIMALIAVREEPALSFVAMGLNILNTAFLTGSLWLRDAIKCGVASADSVLQGSLPDSCAATTYWTHVSIHLVILVLGIALFYMNKSKA